jgi:hypothetical protein
MTVTKTIEDWQMAWYKQHRLSDGDYQDWKDYLSISEVIENLSVYGEE